MKNQVTFDIYTEDVNREEVESALLSLGISSFTLIPASGCYNGQSEQSLIIRIIGSADLLENVKKIGWNIKHAQHQATVLLSSYNCTTEIL